jgi:uroporphyrin-III C-methyltransferase
VSGVVYLVGAGPGDPKLLTLRAAEVLGACDVVFVDKLVSRAVLAHVREGADVIDVGKRSGDHAAKQEEIHALLIAHASRGQAVVRLKGGDPFVFGRGGEEALALTEAGILWEIVPGISSGIAAAAYAGIPVTHRGVASRVTFQTAHRAADADGRDDDETLVLFMCGETLRGAARTLIDDGRAPETPVALIRNGTCANQDVRVTTLAAIVDQAPERDAAPLLAVIGEVVHLRARLSREPRTATASAAREIPTRVPCRSS